MKSEEIILAAAAALFMAGVGVIMLPLILPGRLAPGVRLEALAVGGLSTDDAAGALEQFEQALRTRTVTVALDGQQQQYTLEQLGVSLDRSRTLEALKTASSPAQWLVQEDISPIIQFDEEAAGKILYRDLAPQMTLPRNAMLRIGAAGTLVVVKGAPGDQIDVLTLEQDVMQQVAEQDYNTIIPLQVISGAASIQDNEIAAAEQVAAQLLQNGFVITFENQEYTIAPFTVRRLLTFVPVPDPTNAKNEILGVQFDAEGLRQYLATTIAPDLDQPAVNARFAIENDPSVPDSAGDEVLLSRVQGIRVTQFALPQRGQQLDIEATVEKINQALMNGATGTTLAVALTEPDITDTSKLDELGITTLLAEGVTDFVGSPKNRIHNIKVGASKYQGLVIAPGEEFTFNKYLGPVDASGGFLPELVIKTNVTVPEFGGGLCQVSTTAFRAAVESGLKITERRNHSYAVSYYGKPGFDATIYPGHTDLRFLNNTPGYILIQTRVEGTKLFFDFWGTDDGRVVEVDGPHSYDYKSDGSVKATLTQTVKQDEQVLFEDTFYSNYKSPKLFPHILAATAERPPTNVTENSTTPTASPAPQNQNQGTAGKTSPTPKP